jgi:hypothetical protein
LAVNQAISQLNRVDRRLLTLFWHLAERWGRMTPGGVLIPLTLSHRMLSQLIGARRPTVSTALGELAREQRLRRVDDGTWLLGGEPVGEPADANLRRIPPRRRLFARETVPDPDARVPLVAPHTAVAHPGSREDEVTLRSTGELRARLKHLRLESDRMTAELRGACATSAELCRRIHETQRRRAQERERPQS